MDEQQTCDIAPGGPRPRRWYVLDLVLAAVIASGSPYFLPLFGYFDGLNGAMSLWGLPIACMLWLAAAICLIVLAGRAIHTWPRRIQSKRRLRLLRGAVVAGFTVSFVLPFTPLRLPGPPGFCEGFRRYVRSHLEVSDVQTWLGALDPNLCTGEPVDLSLHHGDVARRSSVVDWPEAIARLAPRLAQLVTTDTGKPKIRLTWGGGLIGHWGVEIGPVDMPIPESLPPYEIELGGREFWEEGEERLRLAPGAYVWQEIE